MASYLPSLTHDNLSYYLVPVAWILSILPHFYAVSTYQEATKKQPDLVNPREHTRSLDKDQSLDSKTKLRILRGEAASSNNLENLGLFAAAVVAGNTAGVGAGWMNALAGGYVLARFVYNHVYIFQDLVPYAARTLTWLVSVSCCFSMFIMAAREMNKKTLF
ncbi:hypothetical protein BAUCODRAFT_114410 [Baudoinia panamericana UAMH 10762]|uniref:MAPEG family protein n=1 Tax=Baudoinia panamericana (strain UAMH 10762) TaxID=717646 RepID=M2LF36_BAUPA|nr:uncharacterized protein BAUCODRAFT_114410 [Baudoinia panamericana UAMH 10762]EMC92642.1 hypothetical protein BAUCODRAFT_114410 [Baudoinia panamericana UAMH 10762]